MRYSYRLWRMLGLGLSLSAGLAGIGLTVAVRRPLPRRHGSTALPGLEAPVQILRDSWGVAHIYAANSNDLFLAQGYVHAQDRLWQLDLNRRTGHGQLAEIFGDLALSSDRYLRTLGFSRVVQRELEHLSDEAGMALESYACGINAYIEQHLKRLPVEFSLLRYEPRPWQPADSLVWGKIMALNLSNNWSSEILRARLVAALGQERAAALEPRYPGDHPLTVPAGAHYSPGIGAGAIAAAEAAERFTGGAEGPQGSNAWVVAGTRSRSGKPLLANDPHLGLQLPSLWYENHLECPTIQVIGASLPGVPGVLIGHNARIAWGVTNGMVDTQDLYLEQPHPERPTHYRYGDGWEPAQIVHEPITVKGRPEPVIEAVQITRHGPIISSLIPGEEQPLALRWQALEPGHIQDAVLGLNRAHDWQSFRAALIHWDSPPQNFVYADVDGHIGYVFAGAIPLRRQGDGRLPVPGWDAGYEWAGTIPAAALPHRLDPAGASIVSANHRIVDDSYPYPLPGEWFSGYRAARIQQLLDAIPRHDAASFAHMHTDQLSLPGLELAALVARLQPADLIERRARDLLAGWDGRLVTDQVAGTIYAATRYQLLSRRFDALAGELKTVVGIGAFAGLPANTLRMRSLPGLLERLRQDEQPELLGQAFSAAVAELRASYGDDPDQWHYGQHNRFTLRHPLGILPALGRLLNRGPLAIGGDIDTVCMGHIPRDYVVGPSCTAPSYRLICDTADWDASRSVLPGGQSGQPASRHYADQLRSWRQGQSHPLPWSRAHVEAAAIAQLSLQPLEATTA